MGGGATSRLYTAWVQEQELAYAASASFDEVGAGEGTFDIYVQPKPGITLAQIETAVNDIVTDVLQNGVTKAELTRSLMALKAGDIYARDDGFNVVYRLGLWLMAGEKNDLSEAKRFQQYPTKLQQVTLGDITRVAEKYLNETHVTRTRLVANQAQLGS